MKSTETKNRNQTEKNEQTSPQQDTKRPQDVLKTEALAALHSLQIGERPALSPEKSGEAAGLLGNQNVLKLIETGAEIQRRLAEAGMGADIHGLAAALSGPPDGPVCDMETLFG